MNQYNEIRGPIMGPIIILILLLCLALTARAATITVTEVGDGFGVHTNLRQALVDANDGDTIEFAPTLGGRDLPIAAVYGQFVVNKSVTIRWVPTYGGASYLGVDAGHASRVFYINPGKTVVISGLTIKNGSAPQYFGGGIYNDHADLTLSNCTISGNSADQGVGGGIYNDQATLTVSNCTISGNSTWYGAGIATNWSGQGSATVTITNSTLSGNSAVTEGGAILNDRGTTLTITNCTLSGNSGYYNGGAIRNEQGATLTMTRSTLSGNSTNYDGGGIFNEGGTVKVGNTIFNAGASGANISNLGQLATVTSLGYNFSSDNGGGYLTAVGDHINTDPKLGPLQDNGGPTFTHLPAADSPAVDGGDPTLGMDQRGTGFSALVNGRIDAGAVEAQATPAPTPTPAPTATPKPHGKPH